MARPEEVVHALLASEAKVFFEIIRTKVNLSSSGLTGSKIMEKRMLINAVEPEECRIAILENNVLEELYIERSSREQISGNIYKAKIVNIESSIEAAFVDIGFKKHGFLHVSDVFVSAGDEAQTADNGNRNKPQRESYKIRDILHQGAGGAGPGYKGRHWHKGSEFNDVY